MTYQINNSQDILGSSRQGSLFTTFKQLKNTFGEPTYFEEGSKLQAQWILITENGDIISIYDYKEDRSLENVDRWSIGGFNNKVAKKLKIILEEEGAEYEKILQEKFVNKEFKRIEL